MAIGPVHSGISFHQAIESTPAAPKPDTSAVATLASLDSSGENHAIANYVAVHGMHSGQATPVSARESSHSLLSQAQDLQKETEELAASAKKSGAGQKAGMFDTLVGVARR